MPVPPLGGAAGRRSWGSCHHRIAPPGHVTPGSGPLLLCYARRALGSARSALAGVAQVVGCGPRIERLLLGFRSRSHALRTPKHVRGSQLMLHYHMMFLSPPPQRSLSQYQYNIKKDSVQEASKSYCVAGAAARTHQDGIYISQEVRLWRLPGRGRGGTETLGDDPKSNFYWQKLDRGNPGAEGFTSRSFPCNFNFEKFQAYRNIERLVQ